MTQARTGHRWLHRPNKFSRNRYVCRKCGTTLVGGSGSRPSNDMRLRPPVTSSFRDRPPSTCEELMVFAVSDL